MPQIEFGSRAAANEVRDNLEEYRARTDDRRSKTVHLQASTPDNVLKRLKERAFTSQRSDMGTGGAMQELTDDEQRQLKQVHDRFSWSDHGFEAMQVKGTLKARGVTDWTNYYEPGEGSQSALAKLEQAKKDQQQTRAPTAVEADYTDMEEMTGMDDIRRQAERGRRQQADRAKEPAIVDTDADAQEFLREEQLLGNDPFDLSFNTSGAGETVAGRDAELMEQRNADRSAHARLMDDLSAAEVTRDPIKWANNPDEYDFPGIDTPEPEEIHERRSERARDMDNQEKAPIADSVQQWAREPDEYDWPGVDTPGAPEAPGEMPEEVAGAEAPDTGQQRRQQRRQRRQESDPRNEIDPGRLDEEVADAMTGMDRSMRDMDLR